MNFIKTFLFWIILTTITGCDQNGFHKAYQISNDEKIADEIMKNVAQDLKTKLDLYPCGTGGQMMHQIEMLALAFRYYKPVTIEEGRELLITSVDTFVDAINADERIRPYLANYPFEPKNVQISIFLRNPNDSRPSYDNLVVISSVNGIFEYRVDDSQGPLFVNIHEESYQEALQAQKALDSHLLKIAQ